MASHKAGRPAKPARKKRQQLHISLYAEDIERLDQLTDNRSEFLRQCIAKAWEEQDDREVTLSVTLPKSLARELLQSAEEGDTSHRVTSYRIPAIRREPNSVA